MKSRRQWVNWLQVRHGVWYHVSYHTSLGKTGPCFCQILLMTKWGRTIWSVLLMHLSMTSDLEGAGFQRVQPSDKGHPGYDPADLPKLYIYGYLNCIRSSRRLEAEAVRWRHP